MSFDFSDFKPSKVSAGDSSQTNNLSIDTQPTTKIDLVEQLRNKTNYPWLRNLINTLYFTNITILVLTAVFTMILFPWCIKNNQSLAIPFELSIGIVAGFLFIKIWYETTILFIDIADCLVHSTYFTQLNYMLNKKSKDA